MKEIRKRCAFLNQLLQNNTFLEKLCNYSDNDLEKVLQNMGTIIEIYLETDSISNIQELFDLIPSFKCHNNFVYCPSNTCSYLTILINGISASNLSRSNIKELNSISESFSFIPSVVGPFNPTSISDDILTAIKEANSEPKILYEDILKQPSNQEKALSFGESKTSYYMNIFASRLENVRDLQKSKVRKISHKIKSLLAYEPMIIAIPSTLLKYHTFSEKYTYDEIKPKDIIIITIPNIFTLLNICHNNLNTQKQTLLDIKTGKKYKPFKQTPRQEQSIIRYRTFENLTIDDTFTYYDETLTGDALYDIDILYGAKDYKENYLNIGPNPELNIHRIKNNSDITIIRVGDTYKFHNGRHRLIYLKNYYLSNVRHYQNNGKLTYLKGLVTVPITIEKSLEDEEINTHINTLKSHYPDLQAYKNNINNDNFDVIITIEGKLYYLKTKEEIISFTKSYPTNDYFVTTINPNAEYISLKEYINSMIRDIKYQIYDMTFIDYITYFKNKNILDKIKIPDLYNEYNALRIRISKEQIYHLDQDIVKDTIELKHKEELGQKIIELLISNPSYLRKDWTDLYEILKSIKEFQMYDSDYLKESAELGGYTRLKTHGPEIKTLKKENKNEKNN